MQSLGGRRFLLAVGVSIGTTALQVWGKLDPAGSTYALVIVGVAGAYITGDVMEKKHANERSQQ